MTQFMSWNLACCPQKNNCIFKCVCPSKTLSLNLGQLSLTRKVNFEHLFDTFVRVQFIPSLHSKVTSAENKKINPQCSLSSMNRSFSGI